MYSFAAMIRRIPPLTSMTAQLLPVTLIPLFSVSVNCLFPGLWGMGNRTPVRETGDSQYERQTPFRSGPTKYS